jgi:hypothetical protein
MTLIELFQELQKLLLSGTDPNTPVMTYRQDSWSEVREVENAVDHDWKPCLLID